MRRAERDLAQAREPDPRRPATLADPQAGAADSCRFDQYPAYRQLRIVNEGAAQLGIPNPYFRPHDGVAGSTTVIEGRSYLNFASYNYLDLSASYNCSIKRLNCGIITFISMAVKWNKRNRSSCICIQCNFQWQLYLCSIFFGMLFNIEFHSGDIRNYAHYKCKFKHCSGLQRYGIRSQRYR